MSECLHFSNSFGRNGITQKKMMKNSVQSEKLRSCTQTLRRSPPYTNITVCAKINFSLHSSLQSTKLFHVTDTMTSEPLQNERDCNWEDHLNLSFQTEDIQPIWTLKAAENKVGGPWPPPFHQGPNPDPHDVASRSHKREDQTFQLYHLLQSTKVERSPS